MSSRRKRRLIEAEPEEAFPAPGAAKKKRGPRRETPLQRFRKQTKQKRAELRKARRDIDRELRAIEKDLGTLKRKPKQ